MNSSHLLLVTSDFPPRLGGLARYYGALASELGCDVLTNVAGEAGVGVWRVSWNWFGWPRWLPLLWLVPMYRSKLDIQYTAAGELLPIGTALWLMRLAFGWPYVVFVHGLDVQLTQRSWWKRWLARRTLSYAKQVIANSQFTAQLAAHAGATATLVVHPGVQVQVTDAALVEGLKQKYQLQDSLIVLSVARLVKRKGISDVLAALPEVAAMFPKLVYVVVGDGPEREPLELAAQAAGVRVLFTGAVSDEELAGWYSACDIFVLTPKDDVVDVEGFGIVYLEAMAASKPVIASHVGGVPEAVGEVGRYAGNKIELAATLRELLARPQERERLGRLGRLCVEQQFTWRKQAATLRQHLYG